MKTVLKYPGSKWNLADTIVSLMPEHHSYLEPFFGSGAVLFSKPPSPIETINDIDDQVFDLFNTIRKYPEELATAIYYTQYAEIQYDIACEQMQEHNDDPIEKARLFLVRSLQSHGFSTSRRVGWKIDVQGRERSYAVKHWNELPEIILQAAERLKQVQIAHGEAIDLIKRFNHENVFMYLDPPYIISSRMSKRPQYRYEMTEEDHIRLLETIKSSKAMIMISGYQSELYEEALKDWYRYEFDYKAEMGSRRKEIIWTNYGERQMTIMDYMNGREE